jgi:hypothetical protein
VYSIIGGTACGVLSTEDKDLIAKLDALAANPKSPVSEISASDFEDCIKKNPPGLNAWKPSPVFTQTPKLTEGAIKGTGAVLVDQNPKPEHEEPAVKIGEPVATVDDALRVGSVEKPGAAKAEGSQETKAQKPTGRHK